MFTSVLISDAGLDPGTGAGLVTAQLALALQEAGDLLTVAACQRRPVPGLDPATPFHGLAPSGLADPTRPGGKLAFDYFACRAVRSLERPPDLAMFYGNPFGLTAAWLRERGCKVVCDLAPHDVALSRQEWERLYQSPWRYDLDQHWDLYTEHVRLAHRVVVHGAAGAAYLRRKCGLATDPVVIPHGCFVPDQAPPLPATFTVGHLSQFGPDKGQLFLLAALKQLGHCPTLIAGEGTEPLLPAAGDLVQRGLKVLGRVERAADLYQAVSVYVQPSVTEGFGIPVLEAMAHGRPVVVAAGAGVVDLVEDGVNGFRVPIRDAGAIAQRLAWLADHPDALARMGQAARETARRWTWERVRGLYQGLWAETLG